MRTLLALIASLLFFAPLSAQPKAWRNLEAMYGSVGKLLVLSAGEELGHCTAFMINETQHYILTADHCHSAEVRGHTADAWILEYESNPPSSMVKRAPAVLIDYNAAFDLAVFRVDLWYGKALKRRTTPIHLGMPLCAMGYGEGAVEPITTYGYVSHSNLRPPFDPATPAGTIVFGNYIAGMSGGPIVDEDRRVVSVVQQGGGPDTEMQDIGYGVSPTLLKVFAEKYWK